MTQPRRGKQVSVVHREKGARQPNLSARMDDPTTVWTEHTIAWYGRTTRKVRLATGTAVWYHGGMPPVPLRWVLIADLERCGPGNGADTAGSCSALTATPPAPQVAEWFVLRWQLEVTFEEARAHLGIETQRQWSDLAILRTTPARWDFSRWLPCLLITCSKANNHQLARLPGMQRRCRRFPIPWPLCVSTFGPLRLFGCRLPTPMSYKFQGHFLSA